MVRANVPWLSKASRVASGKVFTDCGPMSESTYNVSGNAGFLVDVLAHNGRCGRAPWAANRSHLGPLKRWLNR